MPITIYKLDASPPARATIMVAEILKLNYQTIDVDVVAGDNFTPEYLQKNPLHTVPVLEDGDFTLVDSHAIITYLVSKYGADKRSELYSGDLRTKATIDSRLYFDTSILFAKFQAIVRSILFDQVPRPTEKQIAEVNDAYGFLEKYLQRSKFVVTDHMTVADVCCVASLSSSNIVVPVDEKYEKIHEWWNTLKAEDWYKKINEPGLAALSGMLNQAMERNASGS